MHETFFFHWEISVFHEFLCNNLQIFHERDCWIPNIENKSLVTKQRLEFTA